MSALFPHASFGIHLNLTEFQPLTHSDIWHEFGLLDLHGNFNGRIRSVKPSYRLLHAIANEFDAQISFLKSLDLRISHIDSHHHVHTIWWLMPALIWVTKRHKLQYVRNTRNVYGHAQKIHFLKSALKSFWAISLRFLSGAKVSCVFTDINTFHEDPLRSEFLNKTGVELSCHPGQRGFEKETARLLDIDSFIPPVFYLCPFPELFRANSALRSRRSSRSI